MLTENTIEQPQPRVIIRVWTSNHNIRKRGTNNGCVSLELLGDEKKYISFNVCSQGQIKSIQEKSAYNASLEADIKTLKRQPEYTFNFCALDEVSILNKFKELERLGSHRDLDESANFIWKLLLAGGIEKYNSKTEKVVGATQEFLKGKIHKAKGKAVYVENKIVSLDKLPIQFEDPKHKRIREVVSFGANILSKCVPEEIQKNPVDQAIYGAEYSFEHFFRSYTTADNIIKSLKMAQAEEQRRMCLEEVDANSLSNGLKC